MRRPLVFMLALFVLSSFHTALAAPVRVFVSIPPQKYFVEKIAGPLVDVAVMAPPGANPHAYEPRPRQMSELSHARAFLAVGVPFEHTWLPRFAALNKNLLIVHTDRGIRKREMSAHSHGSEDEPHHGSHEEEDHKHGTDPHIWVSPPLALLQARNILAALVEILPGERQTLYENYGRFIGEIAELDTEIMNLFPPGKASRPSFLVFHPAWGYFAEAYGLEETAVEVEGKEPKPAELIKLIEKAREMGVKAIFVQPQMSTRTAETIADAVGAVVTVADPLAEQWASNLRTVARKIAGRPE